MWYIYSSLFFEFDGESEYVYENIQRVPFRLNRKWCEAPKYMPYSPCMLHFDQYSKVQLLSQLF